jgi:hypothetical protein
MVFETMRTADTSLSPAEKDDKESERLIGKRPPPSRKYKPKRGPKMDNRRRRMKVDDKDLEKKPPSKASSPSTLADMALRVMMSGDIATSNKAFRTESMSIKTAEYHGVLKQGHPSGPTNTGYKSIDKRYFGKKHYDSIISSAKEYLSDDWLKKEEWKDGAADARLRAALDLAILTADKNLYASKIDVETYNMLLARLSDSDEDLFS